MKEKPVFLERKEALSKSDLINRVEFLTTVVEKVDVYGNNDSDEFKVGLGREESLGIFKSWAVPVIPFLELGMEDELVRIMRLVKNGGGFEENMDDGVKVRIEKWNQEMLNKPGRFWETMEKWRGYSELYDRRLFQIFEETPLPEIKEERVAELYWRLKVAFGFASPFYNLEAIVGGNGSELFNPMAEAMVNGERGGVLDLVGLMLPSALADSVVTEKLNWNEINWKTIEKRLEEVGVNSDEFSLLMKVSRLTGVDVRDVLFAANVLNWIPVSVGGKKGDVNSREALDLLNGKLIEKTKANSVSVAMDMNALIRFLNWMPLIRSDKNFSGLGWRYAAVCETTDMLLAELDESVLKEEVIDLYTDVLVPQIKHVDAASARGRLLLFMLKDSWFSDKVAKSVSESKAKVIEDVSRKLEKIISNEILIDLHETNSRFLVGGKASGLKDASDIFGKEMVADGFVLTTEVVEGWLMSDNGIAAIVLEMESETDPDILIQMSDLVVKRIMEIDFPEAILNVIKSRIDWNELSVVRSSSFDEDTLINGSAAGVYESQIGIPLDGLELAIKKVAASFFSEKAVSYRFLHGLSNKPMLAMIISPFIPGHGGAVFSDGKGGWEIVTGENPGEVVSSGGSFDSYKKVDGIVRSNIGAGWVGRELIDSIGELANLADRVLGGRNDMEFVVNNDKFTILQLRNLAERVHVNEVGADAFDSELTINHLSDLNRVELGKEKLRLILGENINLDQFQGELFRFLVVNEDVVREVVLPRRIPRTSHFANICVNLGIKLKFAE